MVFGPYSYTYVSVIIRIKKSTRFFFRSKKNVVGHYYIFPTDPPIKSIHIGQQWTNIFIRNTRTTLDENHQYPLNFRASFLTAMFFLFHNFVTDFFGPFLDPKFTNFTPPLFLEYRRLFSFDVRFLFFPEDDPFLRAFPIFLLCSSDHDDWFHPTRDVFDSCTIIYMSGSSTPLSSF